MSWSSACGGGSSARAERSHESDERTYREPARTAIDRCVPCMCRMSLMNGWTRGGKVREGGSISNPK
eukprot:scaffold320_cov138-Isochrysis_galbana.AAC.2